MKKYNIIYADPPWSYRDKKCNGNALNHYNTLIIEDIEKLDINKIADGNCLLFLWATYPLLPEALRVIKGWGFEYKSIAFQWIKLNKINGKPFYGLGRWTRGNTEPCLLGVKGKPKRESNSVFQLIQEKIMRHSKKPSIVREKIVQLAGEKPRIELFAREKISGWDSIGNEIDGKDIREALKELTEEK